MSMKTVHKFKIKHDNSAERIEVPPGSTVLHGDYQQSCNRFCVWVEVDPEDERLEGREIMFLGTGRQILREGWRFVNTFLMQDAGLVFHVYERNA